MANRKESSPETMDVDQLERERDAEKKRSIRAARRKAGLCVTCGEPADFSAKTGSIGRMCQRHLAIDAKRKIGTPARAGFKPLRWDAPGPGPHPCDEILDERIPLDRILIEIIAGPL